MTPSVRSNLHVDRADRGAEVNRTAIPPTAGPDR